MRFISVRLDSGFARSGFDRRRVPGRRARSACLSRPPRRGSAGFSLLEVLVAVVVLSFGVLGVVGLQAAALRANKQARYQSDAVRLARELSDMMRENKVVAAVAPSPYLVSVASGGAAPTASTDCSQNRCINSTTMAQFQISEWVSRVQRELPAARIVVCFDSTGGTPQWSCDNNSTNLEVVVKLGWTQDAFNASASGAAALQNATNATVPLVVLPLIPGDPSGVALPTS